MIEERRARINHMIERYRRAKQRQVLRRAIRLWRKAEAHQHFVEMEAPRKYIH